MPASAVAIVSGGLDSVTLAHDLASQGYELTLLSFDYGQRNHRELACASACARRLGATHRIGDLSWLGPMLPGSALTDRSVEVPDGRYVEDNLAVTEVDGRNPGMLMLACMIAGAHRAELVGIGVHGSDHALYKDCRPLFVERFQAMVDAAMSHPPRLHTPYLHLSKGGICRRGAELGVPFGETWSCYKGETMHCGRCSTCVERVGAFLEAGVEDPTDYADRDFALRELAAAKGAVTTMATLPLASTVEG